MTDSQLWEHDVPVSTFGIEVPQWIAQDITCYDVAAIVQGGCDSGAYMPAVTYHKAIETMAEHGDDVLAYVEDALDPMLDVSGMSWGGVACHFVSCAVELWASSVEDELEEALENLGESE